MSQGLIGFCLLIILLVVGVVIAKLVYGIINFSRSYKYINSEIKRTHGAEREAWIRKKRRLFTRFYRYFKD